MSREQIVSAETQTASADIKGQAAPTKTSKTPATITELSPKIQAIFKKSQPRVFLGMSGGVDSSVAALLLKKQGYHVTGIYMKNWSKDLPGMKCPWAEDLADAKRVAVKLGLDFEVWDFEQAYKEKVVDYMLTEFKRGRTPNPDIMCNEEIKFKLFFETAMKRGADFIATGHYARVKHAEINFTATTLGPGPIPLSPPVFDKSNIEELSKRATQLKTTNTPLLLRAKDENKDQTYFLYRISDIALAKTLFPIGNMLKPEVKKLAAANGLHNAYKKESMGVCFVGEVGMKDFLKEYLDINPGEIREAETEKVLGYHDGAIFYTIGQRHGLYLNGIAGEISDGLPYYVVKKDLAQNIVYVSKNLNHEALWTKELTLEDMVLRGEGKLDAGKTLTRNPEGGKSTAKTSGREVLVRLRHRAPLIPAQLIRNRLVFKQEIKRPAAGQSAVIYDGEVCLGGGIIA